MGDFPGERRLRSLRDEFVNRQRVRPNLVVRPWFSATPELARAGRRSSTGFMVEYCPEGVESVELTIRPGRLRVEGPGGVREVGLDLADGWLLDGRDHGCPETMINHMLRLADRLFTDAA